MSEPTPLERAISAVGGDAAFQAKFQIKRRALFYWRAGHIPAARAAQIARETGVPVHELCPDIFPAPAVAETERA